MSGNLTICQWTYVRIRFVCLLASLVVVVTVVLIGPQGVSVAAELEPVLKPTQIVREHSYDVGQGPPDIEQQVVDEEGTVYLLSEVSGPVPSSDFIPDKWFTATVQRPVSVDLESQGMAAMQSLFDDMLSLETGDYAGILRRQSLTTEPAYRSVEQQIERTLIYSDLVSEDVLQLPESADFMVTSDEGLEATAMQTLRRVAVSWKTSELDGDGRPVRYEATVVFRGTQRQLVLDYFMATASYSGLVLAKVPRETVFATYELKPLPEPRPLPVIRPLDTPEPTIAMATPSSDPLPLIIAGVAAVVMLLALLFFLYFFMYRNARLLRVFSTGKRRVLVRRHLRLRGGEAVFKVDPSLDIYHGERAHLIVLGGRLAGKNGYLTVLWGDQLILRSELRREIDITEELIRAFEGKLGALIQESDEGVLALQGEED